MFVAVTASLLTASCSTGSRYCFSKSQKAPLAHYDIRLVVGGALDDAVDVPEITAILTFYILVERFHPDFAGGAAGVETVAPGADLDSVGAGSVLGPIVVVGAGVF